MLTLIKIHKTPTFATPTWSTVDAVDPGTEVNARVEVNELTSTQSVLFDVVDPAGQLMARLETAELADDKAAVTWTAPLRPVEVKYRFYAALRDRPGPGNGHCAVIKRLRSGELTVNPTLVAVTAIDAAFVPKQEKLEATINISGFTPAKGRIEVWGERYPTDKPIFFTTFDPEDGDNAWDDWYGGLDPRDNQNTGGITEDGPLKGKYLTPEFSPYRVRVITGPDDASVADPLGRGKGKVCLAEERFEVKFQSVQIRLQRGLQERADKAEHRLRDVLVVEPRAADGSYAAQGRLPAAGEHGRLRVPMARHYKEGEALDQGSTGQGRYEISEHYMMKNMGRFGRRGSTKHTIDKGYYTRPELPLELEPRLTSRDNANNDPAIGGLFEPEAVGPVVLEPHAEDYFDTRVYNHATANYKAYWTNASFKVKRGKHDAPHNSGNAPVISHWMARFTVANNGDQEFEVSAAPAANPAQRISSPDFAFQQGQEELTVFLNRARLVRGDTDAELNSGQRDYLEVREGGAAPFTYKIKLGAGLTRAGDILWVVRSEAGLGRSDRVDRWSAYPPGTNCPVHYGGIRGAGPNVHFRKDFSSNPSGKREPIIGKLKGSYPYKRQRHIQLKPHKVKDKEQERVKLQAQLAGERKGLAGVIFSPSYIAGDSYRLKARLEHSPFARSLGEVSQGPWLEGSTGDLSVWRLIRISRSLRLPDRTHPGLVGSVGMSPRVGSRLDTNMNARLHPADGFNMSFTEMNRMLEFAFNEWTMGDPTPIIGATKANPAQITAPAHGLRSGDCIKIHDVKKADLSANAHFCGTFVVRVVDADQFTLHSVYDFGQQDGVGAGYNSNVVAAEAVNVSVAITAVAKAGNDAPIRVTAAGHGLADGDRVLMRGVEGITAANGQFKITVDPGDADGFFLDDTEVEQGGEHEAGSGTAHPLARCGFIDPHLGVNLFQYKKAYDKHASKLKGKHDLAGPANITIEIAPWDYYRDILPPGIPDNRKKLASNTIHLQGPGASGRATFRAVRDAILAHGAGADAPWTPHHRKIKVHRGNANQYSNWVDSKADELFMKIVEQLTPAMSEPRTMSAVRWPRLSPVPVWYRFAWPAPPSNDVLNFMATNGMCIGSGKSFYQSMRPAPGLFEHEELHSCHMVHFVAGNFAWKHHDVNQEDCLMSYTWPSGLILKPPAGVGPLAAVGPTKEEGWPDTAARPNPPNQYPETVLLSVNGAAVVAVTPSINYFRPWDVGNARWGRRVVGDPCAKCLMKLRGWRDERLPFAWKHPDLY